MLKFRLLRGLLFIFSCFFLPATGMAGQDLKNCSKTLGSSQGPSAFFEKHVVMENQDRRRLSSTSTKLVYTSARVELDRINRTLSWDFRVFDKMDKKTGELHDELTGEAFRDTYTYTGITSDDYQRRYGRDDLNLYNLIIARSGYSASPYAYLIHREALGGTLEGLKAFQSYIDPEDHDTFVVCPQGVEQATAVFLITRKHLSPQKEQFIFCF